jgi:hypothetical protein
LCDRFHAIRERDELIELTDVVLNPFVANMKDVRSVSMYHDAGCGVAFREAVSSYMASDVEDFEAVAGLGQLMRDHRTRESGSDEGQCLHGCAKTRSRRCSMARTNPSFL